MKVNPLFSIITPVYNRADCIKRCMASVLAQSFNSFEFIIINDGSTDETLNEIQRIETSFSNIQVISYNENKGVNYARNRGIEQAAGKFIIFLDSDDWLSQEALIQINNTISQYQGYSHYLFGISDRMNDDSMPKSMKEFRYNDWLSGKVYGDFAHVIQKSCFNGLMFIEQFRIYESLNWYRVLRNNQKQLFIPLLITYRERNRVDSVTKESLLDNEKSMQNTYNYLYKFIEWYKEDFENFNLSELLQKQLKIAIIIGLALGERERNTSLIDLLNQNYIFKPFLKISNHLPLRQLFFLIIKTKSNLNQLKYKW